LCSATSLILALSRALRWASTADGHHEQIRRLVVARHEDDMVVGQFLLDLAVGVGFGVD
jgi:hypothetical protein